MKNKEVLGDPFYYNRIYLALGGMLVNSKECSTLLIWYSIYSIVHCQIFLIQEIIQIKYSSVDINFLIENVGMTVAHVLTSLKVLHFYHNRKLIIPMMANLKDKEMFIENDNFRPVSIANKAQKIVFRTNISYFCILMITPFYNYIFGIIQLVSTPYDLIISNKGQEICERILPFYSWFIFKLNNKWNCGLALLLQFNPVLIYGFQIFAVDALVMVIEAELSTHFLLLEKAFETIGSTIPLQYPLDVAKPNRKQTEARERKLLFLMNRYTKQLQTIFELTKQAESLFTYLNLGAVLTSLMIMISCFYTLSTAEFLSRRFYTSCFFMSAMIYQLGIYTSYGNEITLKSSKILKGLYFSDWLPRSLKFKRNILFTMIRLQKPIFFTIGKFSPLTLATFVGILRTAYSFFAVLKSKY